MTLFINNCLSRETINNLLLYTYVVRINYLQSIYNKNFIHAIKQVTILYELSTEYVIYTFGSKFVYKACFYMIL